LKTDWLLNLVGLRETHLKEAKAMTKVFLIIAVAVALFGVAAVVMTLHPHDKAYAYARR
jgi:hypothetical protein